VSNPERECNAHVAPARKAMPERFSLGFFGFGARRFSVTLFIPKDVQPRVSGHFVAPMPGVHSEDFILHS
jgi:hypothetical protein